MFGFLFPRRSWAIQIVENTTNDIRSPLSTEIIEMIIWGSKQLSNGSAVNLKKIDQVIIAADGIIYNPSARNHLKKKFSLDDTELNSLIASLRRSIDFFIVKKNRSEITRVMSEFSKQYRNPKE